MYGIDTFIPELYCGLLRLLDLRQQQRYLTHHSRTTTALAYRSRVTLYKVSFKYSGYCAAHGAVMFCTAGLPLPRQVILSALHCFLSLCFLSNLRILFIAGICFHFRGRTTDRRRVGQRRPPSGQATTYNTFDRLLYSEITTIVGQSLCVLVTIYSRPAGRAQVGAGPGNCRGGCRAPAAI